MSLPIEPPPELRWCGCCGSHSTGTPNLDEEVCPVCSQPWEWSARDELDRLEGFDDERPPAPTTTARENAA